MILETYSRVFTGCTKHTHTHTHTHDSDLRHELARVHRLHNTRTDAHTLPHTRILMPEGGLDWSRYRDEDRTYARVKEKLTTVQAEGNGKKEREEEREREIGRDREREGGRERERLTSLKRRTWYILSLPTFSSTCAGGSRAGGHPKQQPSSGPCNTASTTSSCSCACTQCVHVRAYLVCSGYLRRFKRGGLVQHGTATRRGSLA